MTPVPSSSTTKLSERPRRRRVMRPRQSHSKWLQNNNNNNTLLKTIFILGIIIWIIATISAWRVVHNDPLHNNNDNIISIAGRNLRGGRRKKHNDVWINSDSQPFNDKSIATHASHLIIVAGHSVLISGAVENAAFDDSVWFLYDYQRHKGLPQAIVLHIQKGIQLALQDKNSLLMFSGGETRALTGPETEGGSYFRVADALELWDGRDIFTTGNDDDKKSGDGSIENSNIEKNPNQQHPQSQSTVRARTITEEYATDSFENLLFSICRFYEITGSYPTQISMISFTFKQQRFETLHTNALQWPASNFQYVGVDPPSYTGFNLEESTKGEQKNSLVPFQSDPYGCHTDILQQKRKDRNPFSRKAPYELTCPDMKELLHWCGPELISTSSVPWGGGASGLSL